jgi:hypothetical protein
MSARCKRELEIFYQENVKLHGSESESNKWPIKNRPEGRVDEYISWTPSKIISWRLSKTYNKD